MAETQRKKHFVLVHGASHGAWCWYKIRSLMETGGYKVTCLDLKGAGINQSDPDTILTLEDYSYPLIKFMSNLPDNEKVIMVGHSAGGASLTDSIYRFGKKIEMVIYVAATMLKHGFSTDQDVKDGRPDLSEYGDVNKFRYGMGPDQPPTSVILKDEFQRQILYHMSPLEDSILASTLLRPGPIRPLSGRIDGGDLDAEGVPRVYIRTMHDRVLKAEQQEAMVKKWPPSQVFVLNSDHSPFFSTPFDLFSLLVKAAESIKV
ncbi:methylesterase 17 [Ziziphus jujuba]|uniref:Methylesterase 17 n=1 Tax=Ziziphus jujuba TaxID=326968 RepID=A0A6P3ZM65_ZIZJJ|nr:methylesterase 17 [Ziziphus jujuba]